MRFFFDRSSEGGLRLRLASVALLMWVSLGASCNPPARRGRGGDCHSLSDCKRGLACIEGVCSSDLSSIEGETPEYPEDAPPDAAQAASGDAGAP